MNRYRWTVYPDMVHALHHRDWAALADLYRHGAPGDALFPENLGQSSLDPSEALPGDGTLSLPAALIYAHGIYLADSIHEDPVDLFDDPDKEAIQDLLKVWHDVGGLWDDLGVLSESSESRHFRSLSLLAMEHMKPQAPDAFVSVHFDGEVYPWLELFLDAGWSPLPVNGVPMVHRAMQCGRVMWAELLLEHEGLTDDPEQWPRDRLDNTVMHALGLEEVYAFTTTDARAERSSWLENQPLNAWEALNANGRTPIEHWLLEPNLNLVEDGLAVVEAQGRVVPLRPEVREKAMAMVDGIHHEHLRDRMNTVLAHWQAHWEGYVLNESVDDALDVGETLPTHRSRRL